MIKIIKKSKNIELIAQTTYYVRYKKDKKKFLSSHSHLKPANEHFKRMTQNFVLLSENY